MSALANLEHAQGTKSPMPHYLCSLFSFLLDWAAAISHEDFSTSPTTAKSKCTPLIKHAGAH